MLSAEQKKIIAKLLRIKDEDLDAALTDEKEVALTIPPNLTTLDEIELKRVKDAEYSNGKEKGIEMAVKDAKEKLGVDFQGKSIDGLVAAATKKAIEDAKIPVDQKVKELEKDLQLLRTNNENLNKTIAEKEALVGKASTQREIFKKVPTLGKNAISVDKVLKLMEQDGYDFVIEEGNLVAKKGGETVKNNTAQVIDPSEVIKGYAKENKLIFEEAAPAGRGAGDGKRSPIFGKMSELTKHYQEQGKSTNGEEFLNHVEAVRKDNPQFEMNA